MQLLVNGGDSVSAVISENGVAAYVLQYAMQLAHEQLRLSIAESGLSPPMATLRVEPRALYNPTLDSQQFFVPGIAATLLLVITIIVTALGLSREEEAGTLEQVMVTPIRPLTFILGKTLPYILIGLLDLGLVVAGGTLVFDVPIRGPLWLLFAAGFI